VPTQPGSSRRRRAPGFLQPGLDLSGIEAEQVTPFHEGDAPLGDEATDVALVHAEALGHGRQVYEGEAAG